MSIKFIGLLVGIAVLGMIVLGMIVTRLYKRASKETAFVRTGMGGQRVVKDGGALVIPVVHETLPINMQTLRLTVQRGGGQGSLITKDRLRVDVNAEFYVRVAPDTDSIATAAQTLGKRTMDPQALSGLIEAKFVDALRSAAASMDMQDLHEQRAQFVQKVTTTVAEDLKKNGLELESVSLTNLNQTAIEHFDPNNAFDAEGLAVISRVTSARRKERNDIEKQTEVEIETKNLETTKQTLTLKQDGEFARLDQEREVQQRTAEQESQLAITRAEREREAAQARETATLATEQARIERARGVQIAETEAAQAQEIAAQSSRIAVAEKSEAESTARAKADLARADAAKAAQAVITVEATAKADREAQIAVISAEGAAKQKAAGITVQAEAELAAADAKAKATERLADAAERQYAVDAEGKRLLNEAANVTSATSMDFALREKFVTALPGIIEAMGKPIEKIDSFRVVNLNGVGGHNDNGEAGAASSGSPAGITDALLDYQLKSPIIAAFAQSMGTDLSNGMNGIIASALAPADAATGTDGIPATAPSRRAPKAKVVEVPLPESEKQRLQKAAGIIPTDDE